VVQKQFHTPSSANFESKKLKREDGNVLIHTFTQSIMLGSLTFWFARRKSITGPGVIIMVVVTSANHMARVKIPIIRPQQLR
jgi:hypothetical protein